MDKVSEVSDEQLTARRRMLAAFRDVVLEGSFDSVGVHELARRAGVARSTFYLHFQNRDDVLRESLSAPLRPLANLANARANTNDVAAVLDHFAQNRALTLALLERESASLVRDLLAEMIAGGTRLAYAAAGAQLAVIGAWLHARDRCSAGELAVGLHSITQRLVQRASPRPH